MSVPTKATSKAKSKFLEMEPLYASITDSTPTRRNRAATITRQDRFANIEDGIVPFANGGNGNYTSNINLRDAILLCQKAYYNIGIFRTTIDLMTEFSCSKIKLKGGNEQSRKFYYRWLNKIGINKLQDNFYREYYRSGNIFFFKLLADMGRDNMMKVHQADAASAVKIPLRYLLLNPSDIEILGTSNFTDGQYFKILNSYELQVLLDPKTDRDKRIAAQIPELAALKNNSRQGQVTIKLPLSSEKLRVVFYKKQDYEPFAIPMGFPVLDALNYKAELQKIDMAIARTCQIATLLITMGDEENGPPSPKTIEKMQKVFKNESVARVLISDYTTKGAWLIPNIGNLLNPQKYEVVDRDIRFGLNNILFGEDKFANAQTKTEVFLSRLQHSQEVFLNEFLIPEMEEVGEALSFKDVPTPYFSKNRLEKDVAQDRNVLRLFELGALTPQETFEALVDGDFPDPKVALEHQEEFKKLKDKKLFTPILNQGKDKPEDAKPNGRPTGSKSPQTTKKISPIGTKASEAAEAEAEAIEFAGYPPENLKANLILEGKLIDEITRIIKDKFKLKKLEVAHEVIVEDIKNVIISSESPSEWLAVAEQYVEKPEQKSELLPEIDQIASELSVDYNVAALLYHSK